LKVAQQKQGQAIEDLFLRGAVQAVPDVGLGMKQRKGMDTGRWSCVHLRSPERWKQIFPDSGVEYRRGISPVNRRQQSIQLAQGLAGSERLPSEGEQRAACRIGHPRGQAAPILRGLDEQLPLPSLGVELDGTHVLAEEWVQKIFDLDDARIAGIIRQRI
jgi:hypothetical protein